MGLCSCARVPRSMTPTDLLEMQKEGLHPNRHFVKLSRCLGDIMLWYNMRSTNLFLISTPTVCSVQDTGQRPSEHLYKPPIQCQIPMAAAVWVLRTKRCSYHWRKQIKGRKYLTSDTASRNGWAGLGPHPTSTASQGVK